MVFCTFGARPERQPQRSRAERECRQPEPQPELVRQSLESELCLCGRPQLSSFPALFEGRVFLRQLFYPTALHPSNFVYMVRKRDILFGIKRFYFPRDLQKELEHIELERCLFQVGQLVLLGEIACDNNVFNNFHKERINLFAQRISRSFRKVGEIRLPKFVC